jgi:signal transduction histidine kinase
MPKGGRLTISTFLTGDKKHIAISFEDEGHGIPQENLKKGVGLELAISYGIIKTP